MGPQQLWPYIVLCTTDLYYSTLTAFKSTLEDNHSNSALVCSCPGVIFSWWAFVHLYITVHTFTDVSGFGVKWTEVCSACVLYSLGLQYNPHKTFRCIQFVLCWTVDPCQSSLAVYVGSIWSHHRHTVFIKEKVGSITTLPSKIPCFGQILKVTLHVSFVEKNALLHDLCKNETEDCNVKE